MFSQFNSFSFAKKFNDIGVMNYNISLAIMSVMLFERFHFFFFFFFFWGGGHFFLSLYLPGISWQAISYSSPLSFRLSLLLPGTQCSGFLSINVFMYLSHSFSGKLKQRAGSDITHTHSHTTLTSTPAGRGSSFGRARDSL